MARKKSAVDFGLFVILMLIVAVITANATALSSQKSDTIFLSSIIGDVTMNVPSSQQYAAGQPLPYGLQAAAAASVIFVISGVVLAQTITSHKLRNAFKPIRNTKL